jgi:hypothetical protein
MIQNSRVEIRLMGAVAEVLKKAMFGRADLQSLP